jgi:hypothetical protein
MDKVNKFCSALYKRNIDNLVSAFHELDDQGKYVAVMEALRCILYPVNKTELQRALAYSLFRIFFEGKSTNRVWEPISRNKIRVLSLYKKQEEVYEKLMTGQIDITVNKVSRKITKKTSRKSTRKTSRKLTRKISRKKYDKDFQTKETPEEHDPLILYYKSLYSENPNSECSIEWLTKHGIFNGNTRQTLVKKYERLKQKKKLAKK